MFSLLDDHLSSIEGYRTLFDVNNSLYDMANLRFPARIMLVEHFRCLPEIISFSSRAFYDDRIEPLRDHAPHPNWSALGTVKVRDGYRTGSINVPEANAVVDLIAELIDDPAYEGMTFGVITLLAGDQARLIDQLLLDRLGPLTFRERGIRVGEAAAFQGDERDVMVLSTVVGTDPNSPGRRVQALSGRNHERRINVAASRAKQQMWVVHSVDPESLPSQDLRAQLIRHCLDYRRLEEAHDSALALCDSDFERDVLKRILAKGFHRVRAQYEVGSRARNYRIDLVVEGPTSRLAVECDGERWHGPDRWHDDRVRQEVLERAGWTFERIRGSAFYRNPDTALEPLWRRLDELGIPTGDEWLASDGVRPVSREVSGGSSFSELLTNGSENTESLLETPIHGDDTSFKEYQSPSLARSEDMLKTESTNEIPRSSGFANFGTPPNFESSHSATNIALQPYLEWKSREVSQAGTGPLHDAAAALAEIVSAEGPMHVQRAYQLYVRASGGTKVGRAIRSYLDRALKIAERNGTIEFIRDDQTQLDRTVYAAGTPVVSVRSLGPRQLTDVPKSELKTLMIALGPSQGDSEARARHVLATYGLKRLTERARDYISECATYTWQP